MVGVRIGGMSTSDSQMAQEAQVQYSTEFFGLSTAGQNVILDEVHEDVSHMTAMLSACMTGGQKKRLQMTTTPVEELYNIPDLKVIRAPEKPRPTLHFGETAVK